MASKGMRSVRPGFSKGRKPASRSTESQGRKVRTPKYSPAVRSPGTESKEPKVAASLNKGAAKPIRFFIGGGTTGKKSLVGHMPFDGAKCGFLDLPYDPRVRGIEVVEPKMRKPRQKTNPPDKIAVPVREFKTAAELFEAILTILKLKGQTDGSKAVEPGQNTSSPHEGNQNTGQTTFGDNYDLAKAVEPKMTKPKAVEPGQNTNSPHEVAVPSFQFWNLEDDANDVDVPFQLLNLEDDSLDHSTHSRILT